MERVDGEVVTTEVPGTLAGENAASATSWSTLVELHRSTGRPAGWRASASRPATSSASCGASSACGTTIARATAGTGARDRLACRASPGVRRRHHRARRLPARQHDVRPGRPRRLVAIFDWELATIGDRSLTSATSSPPGPSPTTTRTAPLGLGAVTREPGFPPATSWWPATRSAPALDARACAGTRRSRSGSRSSSSRATTSAAWPARPRTPSSTASRRGAGDRRARRRTATGLLVDFGGVLTTNVLRVVRGVLRGGGPRDAHRPRQVHEGPAEQASCSTAQARHASTRRSSSSALPAVLEVDDHAGLIDRLFAGMSPDEGDARRRPRGPPGRRAHRADLELLGRRRLRPRPVGVCSTAG